MKFIGRLISKLKKLKKLKFEGVIIFLGLIVIVVFAFFYFESKFCNKVSFHDERKDFLKLSSADMASDFDYYVKFMEQNSPIFAIAQRNYPHLRERIQEVREEILKSESNFRQCDLIDYFAEEVFVGHSGILLWNVNDFIKRQFVHDNFEDTYEKVKCVNLDDNLQLFGFPGIINYSKLSKEDFVRLRKKQYGSEIEKVKRDLSKIFADPQIVENTEKFNKFFNATDHENGVMFKINKELGSVDASHNENVVNTEFKVLEPDKIAYMKIKSFSVINETETQKFKDFYKKISNYDNLIIDLRGNGGGFMWYVYYLLPVFKKSFHVSNIGLFKLGPYFESWRQKLERPFESVLCHTGVCTPETKSSSKKDALNFDLKPISELPSIPGLKFQDIDCATHFTDIGKSFGFVRKGPTDLDFHGKVYLLIDSGVASAAVQFTDMARASKEVTVIGTSPTAPVSCGGWSLFTLPKSKIVMAYETCNVLNEDGTSQLEFGIEPHILYTGSLKKKPDGSSEIQELLEWLVDKLKSPEGFDEVKVKEELSGKRAVNVVDL